MFVYIVSERRRKKKYIKKGLRNWLNISQEIFICLIKYDEQTGDAKSAEIIGKIRRTKTKQECVWERFVSVSRM